jgi:glutathione S-transferase
MASAQPKITLHSLERSRAQRIAWLLEELGLEYAIVPYKRAPPQGLAPPELHAVHPLGKSPVLTIDGVDADDTSAGTPQAGRMVLAESGFIAQYLCEHTNRLLPQKWTPGREGQMGGETDAWRRWMYMLHYAEGSFMPVVVLSLVMSRGCP